MEENVGKKFRTTLLKKLWFSVGGTTFKVFIVFKKGGRGVAKIAFNNKNSFFLIFTWTKGSTNPTLFKKKKQVFQNYGFKMVEREHARIRFFV